jgi:hypothetical protein
VGCRCGGNREELILFDEDKQKTPRLREAVSEKELSRILSNINSERAEKEDGGGRSGSLLTSNKFQARVHAVEVASESFDSRLEVLETESSPSSADKGNKQGGICEGPTQDSNTHTERSEDVIADIESQAEKGDGDKRKRQTQITGYQTAENVSSVCGHRGYQGLPMQEQSSRGKNQTPNPSGATSNASTTRRSLDKEGDKDDLACAMKQHLPDQRQEESKKSPIADTASNVNVAVSEQKEGQASLKETRLGQGKRLVSQVISSLFISLTAKQLLTRSSYSNSVTVVFPDDVKDKRLNKLCFPPKVLDPPRALKANF